MQIRRSVRRSEMEMEMWHHNANCIFKTLDLNKITGGEFIYREKKGTYERTWGNPASRSSHLFVML